MADNLGLPLLFPVYTNPLRLTHFVEYKMDLKGTRINKRYLSLDGLRGIAAILVVLLHVDWSNHLTENNFVRNGYLAVDLFFVLSGFVIAANYSARIHSMSAVGQFLTLRIFRLYPLHLAVLSLFVVMELGKLVAVNCFGVSVGIQAPFTENRSVMALFANMLLIQGLHLFPSLTWNGPSWSISCEFAAYVIFVVAFFFRLLRGKLYVWGGLVAATACYLWIVITKNTLDVTTDWGVLRCFAGFYLGTIAFLLAERCRGHFDFSGLMQLSELLPVSRTLS